MLYRERKLNRLRSRDYSRPGWYFVTVCCKNMKCWLGKIENNKFIPNKYGQIVKNQWLWLENHFQYLKFDEWVIMPNHVHGIIGIVGGVGNGRDRSVHGNDIGGFVHGNDIGGFVQGELKSISELIGAFKTTSSKMIHQEGLSDFKWHKSFYDRIIRNMAELERIRFYIKNNPKLWYRDRNNLGVNNH